MSDKERLVLVGANRLGKSNVLAMLAALSAKYEVEMRDEMPKNEFKIIAQDECMDWPAHAVERKTKADRKRNKRNRWR